jgi:transcriptional regulator with XRE-family HTH domain
MLILVHGGEVIANARRRAAMTQSALAGRLGTTKSAVSRWEHGRVEPSFRTVVRAAEACSVSLSSLLSEPEADPHDLSLLETGSQLSYSERLQRLIYAAEFIESGRRSLDVSAR